jgi:DNA invertase Pin-like site-specific DNA recombinase
MKAAIYARVSAVHQDLEIQLAALREYVSRQGWETTEYVEKLSGKEGSRRPEMERLLADAQNRRFEVCVAWKMDRFGRSALDALENVRSLSAYGVRFLVTTMPAIDTDDRSPFAKCILTMMAAFAELERAFIVERTHAGQIAYRASFAAGKVGAGKGRHSKSGKDLPVGRQRIVFDRRQVAELAAGGASIRQIAKVCKLKRSVVHAFLQASKHTEMIPQVAERAAEGASIREVAQALGLKRRFVGALLDTSKQPQMLSE